MGFSKSTTQNRHESKVAGEKSDNAFLIPLTDEVITINFAKLNERIRRSEGSYRDVEQYTRFLADELDKHSKNVELVDQMAKWEKKVQEMSKFGEFEITLSNQDENEFTGTFYLEVVPTLEDLSEFWHDYEPENRDIVFPFGVGLIPKNREDIQVIRDLFDLDFYNSFFWGFWINVKYKVENSSLKFEGISMYSYEPELFDVIINRKSANSLKRLIVSLFDPSTPYPSGYTDITDFYEKVEVEIIQGLETSADYGLDMERIKNDLQKLPSNNFLLLE
jgi:hypothetical protein